MGEQMKPGKLISIKGLYHVFKMGNNYLEVLKGISLDFEEGEYVSLLGKSGSGKSTLLNIIGGLMKPRQGTVSIAGTDITALDENQMAEFRAGKIGFVFQSYNLIPTINTFDNVELPLVFLGLNPRERKEKVEEVLEIVGLENHKEHLPGELSGGEQQRASIARALIAEPIIVLADEPTGNLDTGTEAQIMAFMKKLNRDKKITFIIVTHDQQISQSTDRIIYLQDGMIISDEPNTPREEVFSTSPER